MMTLLEIVLRQSPSLRAASLHEEIGWISITIVPCSAVKICDINNHYLHRALINMQVRTCSVVQLSPSWGWAHHWAWIASSGFSKKIFLEFFPSKTKHLLFFFTYHQKILHTHLVHSDYQPLNLLPIEWLVPGVTENSSETLNHWGRSFFIVSTSPNSHWSFPGWCECHCLESPPAGSSARRWSSDWGSPAHQDNHMVEIFFC